MVYVWIDGIILSLMTTPAEVGWYAVGAQIIATLGFVPAIVTTVVFPELSKTFHTDRARTAAVAGASFRLLVTLSLPMVAGLALIAPTAVTTIYGGWFAPAGAPLTILALTLLPVFVATLGNVFIIAADRQLQWTGVMGAICVINPLLNLLAIPYFHAHYGNGALGAAVALLVTDVLTGVLALVLLPASLRFILSTSAPALVRALIATAIMAAAVWPFHASSLPISVLIGGVTFVASAILLHVFPAEELQALRGILVRVATKPFRMLGRPRPPEADSGSAA